jgi:membrane protease YdiL (CAAX protease family)
MGDTAYGSRACYGELWAVILAGAAHVAAELAVSEVAARLLNGGLVGAFLIYVIWRARQGPGVFHRWGMRRDNFWPAMGFQLLFVVVGVGVLAILGAALGSLMLPGTFWVALALYPIWGLAQQFALQNLIAKNLEAAIPREIPIAVAASCLFGIAHFPRMELVALTVVAGFFFTLIYRRVPNLWAVGIAHGILGSVAVYVVLGKDPGATILAFVFGR